MSVTRKAGLDPEGMIGQCIRCGATVPDDELQPDSLGNGYCAACRPKVDDDGCELYDDAGQPR